MRARIFRKKNLNDVDDPFLKYAREAARSTADSSHGAALVEVRLPVEQSVVFELVRTALCFVSCRSSASSLLEMYMRHVPVIGVACDSLQQQQ